MGTRRLGGAQETYLENPVSKATPTEGPLVRKILRVSSKGDNRTCSREWFKGIAQTHLATRLPGAVTAVTGRSVRHSANLTGTGTAKAQVTQWIRLVKSRLFRTSWLTPQPG